jgi:hypothetical protein
LASRFLVLLPEKRTAEGGEERSAKDSQCFRTHRVPLQIKTHHFTENALAFPAFAAYNYV